MKTALKVAISVAVGLFVSVTCPLWNTWIARLFGQRDGDGPALQGIPFGFLMLLPVSATAFFAMSSVRNRFARIGLYVSLTLAVLTIGADIAGLAYQSTAEPPPLFHVNVKEGTNLVEQLRKERPEVQIESTEEPDRLVVRLRRGPSQIGKCVITADGLLTCVIEENGTIRYSDVKQIPNVAVAKRFIDRMLERM
jgi:hypothetical protein